MSSTNTLNTTETRSSGNPFQCAILLDDSGREVPITEEMIMNACDELMKLWQFPQKVAA